MHLALVCLFVVYRETSGTNGTCVCYDNNGGVYNLQPLQRTDGDPRFESRYWHILKAASSTGKNLLVRTYWFENLLAEICYFNSQTEEPV